MALRDTLAQLYVFRKTLGNSPLPLRVTESQLYVFRTTLGNVPFPMRLTQSQLYVFKRTTGQSNRLPIQNTTLTVSLIRTAKMPDSPPFRVTQLTASLIVSEIPDSPPFRVSQLSVSLIIKLPRSSPRIRPVLGPLTTVTLTIPAGQALSDAMMLEPTELLVGVLIPDSWTSADLGFDVTIDGVVFREAKAENAEGNLTHIRIRAEAGKYIVFDPMKIPAIRWFKLRSMDFGGNSVNQAAQRTLRVVKVRIA